MPLLPEAKEANVAQSLTDWIQATLVTQAGLAVFYADGPLASRPAEWVHVDFLLGLRRTYGRQVGRDQYGGEAFGIVNLNLCKKRPPITSLFSMVLLRDRVMPYFQEAQTIPLRDYAASGDPVIGILVVRETTSARTDDGATSGLMVMALSIHIAHVEAWTLV